MNETRWPACGIAYAQGDAVRHLLSLAVLVPTLVLAADIPPSRDPQTYLVLGMQRTTVNSLSLEPPGCNVGVNCAPWSGSGEAAASSTRGTATSRSPARWSPIRSAARGRF